MNLIWVMPAKGYDLCQVVCGPPRWKGGFFTTLKTQLAREQEPSGAAGDGVAPTKVRVSGVCKGYAHRGRWLPVLQGVDMYAAEGELVAIIGPSGGGKSTLLHIIAGLEQPDAGSVYLDGTPADRRLGATGYMQQKDLLLPWRSVLDNAILAIEVRGVPRRAARARALGLMEQFGLKGFEKEYPHALSGGMRQRVSFMRTVLADPEVFLLDEPFGALDALTRAQMQEWLLGLWEKMRKTIMLVTHDVDEAIFLADRVYAMTARPGRDKLMERVELPRPRTREMLASGPYVALKARLLRSLGPGGGPAGEA